MTEPTLAAPPSFQPLLAWYDLQKQETVKTAPKDWSTQAGGVEIWSELLAAWANLPDSLRGLGPPTPELETEIVLCISRVYPALEELDEAGLALLGRYAVSVVLWHRFAELIRVRIHRAPTAWLLMLMYLTEDPGKKRELQRTLHRSFHVIKTQYLRPILRLRGGVLKLKEGQRWELYNSNDPEVDAELDNLLDEEWRKQLRKHRVLTEPRALYVTSLIAAFIGRAHRDFQFLPRHLKVAASQRYKREKHAAGHPQGKRMSLTTHTGATLDVFEDPEGQRHVPGMRTETPCEGERPLSPNEFPSHSRGVGHRADTERTRGFAGANHNVIPDRAGELDMPEGYAPEEWQGESAEELISDASAPVTVYGPMFSILQAATRDDGTDRDMVLGWLTSRLSLARLSLICGPRYVQQWRAVQALAKSGENLTDRNIAAALGESPKTVSRRWGVMLAKREKLFPDVLQDKQLRKFRQMDFRRDLP